MGKDLPQKQQKTLTFERTFSWIRRKRPKLKFENKFGIPEIIALAAVVISIYAVRQSSEARNDARVLNKLDFRPTLSLKARLQRISKQIPAHIEITNKGPVDAKQIQIEFHFLRYISNRKAVAISATSSDFKWFIDRLPPLKQATIKINESSLNSLLSAIGDIEKHHRILEIHLNYRREVDLKEYSESAFYFVSQEGKWVSEINSAIDSEIYKPIKEAALSRFKVSSDMLNYSDKLHELPE